MQVCSAHHTCQAHSLGFVVVLPAGCTIKNAGSAFTVCLPLLPLMKQSPYLFFNWPLTYSCSRKEAGHVLSGRTAHTARLLSEKPAGSHTSVCSMAMFIYPSRHARMPTPKSICGYSALGNLMGAILPSCCQHGRPCGAVHALSVGLMSHKQHTPIVYARVELDNHGLSLDALQEVCGRLCRGRPRLCC
jgi:hypothetical protein